MCEWRSNCCDRCCNVEHDNIITALTVLTITAEIWSNFITSDFSSHAENLLKDPEKYNHNTDVSLPVTFIFWHSIKIYWQCDISTGNAEAQLWDGRLRRFHITVQDHILHFLHSIGYLICWITSNILKSFSEAQYEWLLAGYILHEERSDSLNLISLEKRRMRAIL